MCLAGWYEMLTHGWNHSSCGPRHWMTYTQELVYWLLMVAAMMLPFDLGALRLTTFCSLWERRHRAALFFLFGYTVPWLLLGILVAYSRTGAWTHFWVTPVIAFAFAAVWQVTPFYGKALTGCHLKPVLAPLGWRADRDAADYGYRISLSCLVGCWPLMLACAFTGHGIVAMVGGMILGAVERFSFRPRTGMMTIGTVMLGIYYAISAF